MIKTNINGGFFMREMENKLFKVEERIKKVIINQLELEDKNISIDSTDETFLNAYNLNSIDALELLLRIEQEFGIEIADDDLNSELLNSVRSIGEYVVKLI